MSLRSCLVHAGTRTSRRETVQFISAGSLRFHPTVYFPLSYFAGQVPHSAADGDVIWCQSNRLWTETPRWIFLVFFCFKLQENPENQDQQREFTEERLDSLEYLSSRCLDRSASVYLIYNLLGLSSFRRIFELKMICVWSWFWSEQTGERSVDNVSYSRWYVTLQSWQKLSEATGRFWGCSHFVINLITSDPLTADINNTRLRTVHTWEQPASEGAAVIRRHLPAQHAKT